MGQLAGPVTAAMLADRLDASSLAMGFGILQAAGQVISAIWLAVRGD